MHSDNTPKSAILESKFAREGGLGWGCGGVDYFLFKADLAHKWKLTALWSDFRATRYLAFSCSECCKSAIPRNTADKKKQTLVDFSFLRCVRLSVTSVMLTRMAKQLIGGYPRMWKL